MANPVSIKTLKDLGEEAIIRLIHRKALSSPLPAHIKKGIGDDAAVLKTDPGKVLLVTTDTLVEGIHFTTRTMPDQALGWKALAVNVSDIAAMGGRPHTAFLSLGMTGDTAVDFVESFMTGFEALAGQAGIALAGGDVVEVESSRVISVSLLGDCVEDRVVYRSGARAGDDLWVTGPLGDAAAGLFLLLHQDAAAAAEYESLVLAHQRPMPRHELGRALAEKGLARAMIDLSDGIAKDLGHICEESGTGAIVQADSLPLSRELGELAAKADKSPLDWALHGGEDYEILFTAPPAAEGQIVSLTTEILGAPAVRIGTMVKGEGLWLETNEGRQPLRSGGYTHFS